jgi:hypothetical protein
VKKSLWVSIVIPALDPSPVLDIDKKNNILSELSAVRLVNSDNALLISLEESSWDSYNSGGVIKRHQCKFCSRYFKSSQALGGHTSKAHPAMSIQYAKKMQVRRKN